MTLSEKVKYVRAKLRLTQKELSKKTGILENTIIKWETEQTTKPQMSNYDKLMDFCTNQGIDFKNEEVKQWQ